MKCKNLKLKVKLVYDESIHSYSVSDEGFNCSDFTHSFDIDICTFGKSSPSRYFIIKSFKVRGHSIRPFFVPVPISLDYDYSPAAVDQSLSALYFNPYSPFVHKLLCLIHTYILTF